MDNAPPWHKLSHGLWPGELKMKFATYYTIKYHPTCTCTCFYCIKGENCNTTITTHINQNKCFQSIFITYGILLLHVCQRISIPRRKIWFERKK